MQRSHQPRIKLQFLVLGAANAGKTSILRRHFQKTFREGTRVPTLGSDFYVGRIKNPVDTENNGNSDDSVQINLQMWVRRPFWVSFVVRVYLFQVLISAFRTPRGVRDSTLIGKYGKLMQLRWKLPFLGRRMHLCWFTT